MTLQGRRRSFAGIWLLLAVTAACSSDGSGTAKAPPIPEDQFVDQLVSAVCDNIGPCCGSSGFSYDAANCRASLRPQYAAFFGFLDPSTVSYDANAGGACVQLIKQAASECRDVGQADVCSRVFIGNKKPGEPCVADLECASFAAGEVSCEPAVDGTQQTCVAAIHGRLGDSCNETCTKTGSGVSCTVFSPSSGSGTCYTNDGVYCSSSSSTCATIHQMGQECSDYGSCVPGAYCDDAGTCVRQKPDGSPCTSFDECINDCMTSDTEARCGNDGIASAFLCGQENIP